MKVYELMIELSELPAGQDIKVGACISSQELTTHGEHVTDDHFYLSLTITDVDEDGIIDTRLD